MAQRAEASRGRTVPSRAGIDGESAAICRAVRAVARRRLLRRLGAVSPTTLEQIEGALTTVLGLETA